MNSRKCSTIITLLFFNIAISQIVDTTFGNNGIVVTELSQGVDKLSKFLQQPDEKIVAFGTGNNKLTLVRYDMNGLLDTTFGSGGIVMSNFNCGGSGPFDMALQTDGKIVVSGQSIISNSTQMIVARFNTNGIIDQTFGVNGVVNISAIVGSGPFCNAMELMSNGKIIINGYNGLNEVFIMRLNSNGNLDTSFGTNGSVAIQVPTGYSVIFSHDLIVQTDGEILVLSEIYNTLNHADFCLFRYNSEGVLDTSFGINGMVKTDIGGVTIDDYPITVKLQEDGKILVSGTSNLNFAVVRYNTNGSLDVTFNSTGIVTTNVGVGYKTCSDMLIEPNGGIIVAGDVDYDFTSVRYQSNGSIDTNFGNNGIFKIDFGNSYDFGNAIVRQTSGKLVMGGYTSYFCSNRAFAMTRFNSPALSNAEFGSNKNDFNIIPNPAQNYFELNGDKSIENLKVYSMLGQLVKMFKQQNQYSISDLSKGSYIVKIITLEGTLNKKLLIE